MHGTSGVPIPVTTIGGLVTLAKSEALPEGASPRNYDYDYDVGGGRTRDGLTNVASYAGAAVGPSPGGAAADVSTGGSTWNNPDNTLVNTGVYATTNLSAATPVSSSTSTGSSSGGGVAWSNPGNIDSSSAFATVSLSSGSGGNISPLQSYGTATATATAINQDVDKATTLLGFSSLAATSATLYVSVNQGLTVSDVGYVNLNYSTDGGSSWNTAVQFLNPSSPAVYTIPVSGITNLDQVLVQIEVNIEWGSRGTAPVTLTASITNWYAVVASSGGGLTAQTLKAAVTGLTVPAEATITGVQVAFKGEYSGVAPAFDVNLSVGSTIDPVTLTTSSATYTLGGSTSLWGYSGWTPVTLSSLVVSFNGTSTGTTTISANTLVVTVYYTGVESSDALDITEFGFSVPPTSAPQGFEIAVKCYATAAATLSVQMMKAGVPAGIPASFALPIGSVQTVPLGSITDLFSASWLYSDLDSTTFGLRISATATTPSEVYVGYVTLTCSLVPQQCNVDYIGTFVAQNGVVKNLALDADGNLYVSNQTSAPGVYNLAWEGITPNSYAIGVNGPDVEYLAISNLLTGSDQPMQYTPNWIDRITQVGPGAAPVFTPLAGSANTYAISTITQPPRQSDPAVPGYFVTLQQSEGPTSVAPGNVVTVFYAQSLLYPQDMVLANAFNSGQAVYVYVSGTSLSAANGTFLVSSIGNVIPPGGSHYSWYFTYQVAGAPAYQQFAGGGASPGYYQMSVATMTTSVPVPGLTVGNNITISGASVSGWDSTWPISQTLNSSQMVITGSAVTASIATFNYALSGGSTAAPAAGQLITITGTTNANDALNLTNATIATATGGSTGSFTIPVSVLTAAFAPEDGEAVTAGTIFAFDPGLSTLGTSSNPIFGNSTGGTLTFVAATAQLIATGTKQGSVFFITRNGYYTAPAPPVTFTIPENTTGILASQMPIGPPNVVARGIILTESGQNGVPGANFFTIPTPVTYIVENVSYTATALIVNDNTSTSATFQFTDSVLLNALAVDVYGYNLFNQIEIGDPGWIAGYGDRNAYGLCRNKVQNFNNLSFDGGYLSAAAPLPLGWSQPDIYGSLIVSAKFGDAYYIENTTVSTLAVAGLIQQSAYQDAYLQPIIEPNTAYSVRLTAAIPSGNTTGNLVISLVANGITYGSYTLPFASMSSDYEIYTGTLLTSEFLTTPTALQIVVQATEIGAGADLAIDRIDVYPTAIPILTTTVLFSYAGLFEQVDAVTGPVGFSNENQQPVNGGMVLYDTFYALKGWAGNAPGSSLYSLQASSNLEPAQWQAPEVAQRSGGAIGPLAFDLAEQWFLGASRQGLYLFEGGQPGKIMQEIYQIWDAINWQAGNTIWVRVDIVHRKIYVGIPLPTPNFWLPNAPVNAAPTSPNVILVCNYQGIDSGQELRNMPQMHTTMFGTLNAIDMRRKWSIWQIPSPYAAICQGATDEELFICNGKGNSKIYILDSTAQTDDGMTIDSLYTTAGLPELSKRPQMQGVGNSVVRYGYMSAAVQSSGNVQVRLLPNRLLYPEPADYAAWSLAGGMTPGNPALYDAESALNFAATRTFVEFRENDGYGFTLSNLLLLAKKDTWNQFRGRTGVKP